MFLATLKMLWLLAKYTPAGLFVLLILLLIAAILYLLSGMVAKPLPESIPTEGPEPTEEEFNSPE